MSNLERAIAIAVEGQKDKAGEPYILRPLRVMFAIEGEDAQTAAVLHDVVEDSGWTLDAQRAEGFSETVVAAVDALTKREGEAYTDFVARAAATPIGRAIKIADLRDNLSDARGLSGVEGKKRREKYRKALRQLSVADEPSA